MPAMLQCQHVGRAVNDYIAGRVDGKGVAQGLWQHHCKAGHSLDSFAEELWSLCRAFLLADKNSGWDKACKFMQVLGTACSTLPAAEQDSCGNCLEAVLQRLAPCCHADDAQRRQRVVLLIEHIMCGISLAGLGLSEPTQETLIQHIQERLTDSTVAVRKIAIQVLAHLGSPEDDGHVPDDDPVLTSLVQRLQEEETASVRAVIVKALYIQASTLDAVTAATRDESDEVREEAWRRLGGWLHILQQENSTACAQLLHRGLTDGSSKVRAAVTAACQAWLTGQCNGDVHQLLASLPVAQNPETAQKLLDSLHADADDMVTAAVNLLKTTPGGGLRRSGLPADSMQQPSLLTAEQAFTRRYACMALHAQGALHAKSASATGGAAAEMEAAKGCDALDVLEAVLPATAAELSALVAEHAAAGPQHRFAALQLLQVTTACTDWADSLSREAGLQLLQQLLSLDPRSELSAGIPMSCALAGCGGQLAWEASVMQLAAKLLPELDALAPHMMTMLQQLAHTWGLQQPLSSGDQPTGDACCWVQCCVFAEYTLRFMRRATPCHLGLGAHSDCWQLYSHLLAPGLMHPDDSVKCASLRALSLLSLMPAANHLMGHICLTAVHLLAQPNPSSIELRAQAFRTLWDALLIKGGPQVKQAVWNAHLAAMSTGSSTTAAIDDLTDQLGGTNLHASPRDEAQQVQQEAAADVIKCLVDALGRVLAGEQQPEPQQSAKPRRKASKGSKAATEQAQAHSATAPAARRQTSLLLQAALEGCTRLLRYQDTLRQLTVRQSSPSRALTRDEEQALLQQVLVFAVHPMLANEPAVGQCLGMFLQAYCRRPCDRERVCSVLLAACQQALQFTPQLSSFATSGTLLLNQVAPLLLKEDDNKPEDVKAETIPETRAGSQAAGPGGACHDWKAVLCVALSAELHNVLVCESPEMQPKAREEYVKELTAVLQQVPLTTDAVHAGILAGCSVKLQQCLTGSCVLPSTSRSIARKQLEKAADRLHRLAAEPAAASVTQEDVRLVMQAVLKGMPASFSHDAAAEVDDADQDDVPDVTASASEDQEDDSDSDSY